MEPRSRETTPTKEDLDFIVDDGYNNDDDPTYEPDISLSSDESDVSLSSDEVDEEYIEKNKSRMLESLKKKLIDESLHKVVKISNDQDDLFNVFVYNSKFSSNSTQEYKRDFREKIELGYFTNLISIFPQSVEAFQEKDHIRLLFRTYLSPDKNGDQYETGGDYVSLYLPLPLEFDDKWIEKYRKVNLTVRTIEDSISAGYVKK